MKMNLALTKEQKVAVIERGLTRLPMMGEEAKWAFGAPTKEGFVTPLPWVRRVIFMTFGVDPDERASNESIDPVKVSKMVGSLLGLAQGAEIVFRPSKTTSASGEAELTEEKLKKGVNDASEPYHAKLNEQAGVVRDYIRQATVEQYAAFAAGQSKAAKLIVDEEKAPGSTTDMTHDLLTFLWTFWPEIPLAGSVHNLHLWITELGYLHCSEQLVGKVCRKAELRLSERGAEKRSPTN